MKRFVCLIRNFYLLVFWFSFDYFFFCMESSLVISENHCGQTMCVKVGILGKRYEEVIA